MLQRGDASEDGSTVETGRPLFGKYSAVDTRSRTKRREGISAASPLAMAAERVSSAYTTRNMRSSLTMMKYLARTSSEGELNKVIHQHARCEGTVADRRRRAGKLRNEQEDLEQ